MNIIRIPVESSESVTAKLAALLGDDPSPGLEVYMRGVDLTNPKEILDMAQIMMSDLNHAMKKADELANRVGHPKILPGLGRHYKGENT